MYKLEELIDYCSNNKKLFYQCNYDYRNYPNLKRLGFNKIVLSTGLFKVVIDELDGEDINEYEDKYENNMNVILLLLDVIDEVYSPDEIYNIVYGMPGVFDEEIEEDEIGVIDASINIEHHSILFQYHFENEFFYEKEENMN